MKTKHWLLLCLLPLLAHAQNPVSTQVLDEINKIDSNRIKAHVTYLADDKLKGRLPGKEGFQMAVDYVVKQYKEMGLKPAGENNTYLQKLTLRKTRFTRNCRFYADPA